MELYASNHAEHAAKPWPVTGRLPTSFSPASEIVALASFSVPVVVCMWTSLVFLLGTRWAPEGSGFVSRLSTIVSPQIHVHPELLTVVFFENRALADVTSSDEVP